MCTATDPLFADLDEGPLYDAEHVVTAAPKVETFPCQSCAGTGRFVFRSGRSGDCYTCKGTGRHRLNPNDQRNRKRGAAKAKVTRLTNIRDGIDAFRNEHPDLYVFLGKAQGWSEFAASLYGQLQDRGRLSEKQVAAAQRMFDKNVARKAERAQAQQAAGRDVDASVIKQLFDRVYENGLRRPRFVVDGVLAISRAPDSGRNAGALYVKTGDGAYAGKIKDGVYMPLREYADDEQLLENIVAMCKDPAGFARLSGLNTGVCCCCGRPLTDPVSVARGIGPICEGRWFPDAATEKATRDADRAALLGGHLAAAQDAV